jgi:hypothetical protein
MISYLVIDGAPDSTDWHATFISGLKAQWIRHCDRPSTSAVCQGSDLLAAFNHFFVGLDTAYANMCYTLQVPLGAGAAKVDGSKQGQPPFSSTDLELYLLSPSSLFGSIGGDSNVGAGIESPTLALQELSFVRMLITVEHVFGVASALISASKGSTTATNSTPSDGGTWRLGRRAMAKYVKSQGAHGAANVVRPYPNYKAVQLIDFIFLTPSDKGVLAFVLGSKSMPTALALDARCCNPSFITSCKCCSCFADFQFDTSGQGWCLRQCSVCRNVCILCLRP